MRSRRRLAGALVAVVLALLTVCAPGAARPAQALPNPFGDCKSAPTPQMPTSGFSGFLDPGPARPPAPGDAFDPRSGTSAYAQYGYPPAYRVYDLGCGGDWVRDPNADLDTMYADWIDGAATAVVAATNSLHRLVAPPTALVAFDPLLVAGTRAMAGGLYGPWLPVSLVLLSVLVLAASWRSSLSTAVTSVAWALLVMTLASTAIAYPVRVSHLADSTVTAVVADVDARADAVMGPARSDPSTTRAAMLVDAVLYRNWLRGELGDPGSAVARRHGPALFDAQHYTYAEAATLERDPRAGQAITDRKEAAFKRVAAQVQDEDPAAYQQLKGQGPGRLGPAFITLLMALLTCPFMALSDLLVFGALVVVRLAVLLFPAFAVVGLHRGAAGVVRGTLSTAAAGLINSVVFSAGASVNALGVYLLLDRGLVPAWQGAILAGMLTVALWVALRPFRSLTTMVVPHSPLARGSGAGSAVARGVGRLAVRAAGAYAAGGVAGAAAGEVVAEQARGQGGGAAAGERAVRPEAWSRPEPALAPALAPAAGQRWAAHPAEALGPPPRPRPARVATASAPGEAPTAAGPGGEPLALPSGASRPRTGGRGGAPGPARDAAPPPAPAPLLHPAGAPLPRPVYRADPMLRDGQVTYRIWDPGTRSYERLSGGAGSEGGSR